MDLDSTDLDPTCLLDPLGLDSVNPVSIILKEILKIAAREGFKYTRKKFLEWQIIRKFIKKYTNLQDPGSIQELNAIIQEINMNLYDPKEIHELDEIIQRLNILIIYDPNAGIQKQDIIMQDLNKFIQKQYKHYNPIIKEASRELALLRRKNIPEKDIRIQTLDAFIKEVSREREEWNWDMYMWELYKKDQEDDDPKDTTTIIVFPKRPIRPRSPIRPRRPRRFL